MDLFNIVTSRPDLWVYLIQLQLALIYGLVWFSSNQLWSVTLYNAVRTSSHLWNYLFSYNYPCFMALFNSVTTSPDLWACFIQLQLALTYGLVWFSYN